MIVIKDSKVQNAGEGGGELESGDGKDGKGKATKGGKGSAKSVASDGSSTDVALGKASLFF